MDKRYQVFVSSTYRDLISERVEIMQALLELDCIPSGMELFPAANDDQWTLIKKVIDDCDYYIVVIGGRYGSISSSGLSYTEMEYRYALEKNKPIIGFLHKNPGKIPAEQSEQSEEGKKKLSDFRDLVETKLVKYWSTPSDLGSFVSRSLIQLIKSNPAVGWVRGNLVPNESSAQEILRLRNIIDDLNSKNTLKTKREDTSNLSQGDDLFEYNFYIVTTSKDLVKRTKWLKFSLSWNVIFSDIAPSLIDECSDATFEGKVDDLVRLWARYHESWGEITKGVKVSEVAISTDDFQTIKVQLRALGLIRKSTKQRSVKDSGTYWSLTEYGDEVMTNLRAIKKGKK